MKLKLAMVGEIFAIGSSDFARTAAMSLTSAIFNNILRRLGGELPIATFGIIFRVMSFVFMPMVGIAQGAQPILGFNYGAYMTEIFRAGIQAIGKGQHEAAQALGMSTGQTFQHVVFPQAFRIVIPPIGNEFIAMMKDSSLVMVMAVWELTFRASKVGRQYFRAMETFIIAAAFYWILTVVFQLLQGKLEEYMARGERR